MDTLFVCVWGAHARLPSLPPLSPTPQQNHRLRAIEKQKLACCVIYAKLQLYRNNFRDASDTRVNRLLKKKKNKKKRKGKTLKSGEIDETGHDAD